MTRIFSLTLLCLAMIISAAGCSSTPASTSAAKSNPCNTDFPMVDYHVHLKGGLTVDQAIAIADENNMKFGIAQNCGLDFPVTDDLGLTLFIKSLKGKNVYAAMQAEGREWVTMFSAEALEKCDYIFSDALTWTDHKGRRMRLWMPNEVFVEDTEQFMDMYVDQIVKIITSEPIDIFVNPTFLPGTIADQYDQVWTTERMDRVIKAAVESKVAIEINARFKIPSQSFICRAKSAGVKFACGTNNGGANDLGDWSYCCQIIRGCGLTQDDMFTPRKK